MNKLPQFPLSFPLSLLITVALASCGGSSGGSANTPGAVVSNGAAANLAASDTASALATSTAVQTTLAAQTAAPSTGSTAAPTTGAKSTSTTASVDLDPLMTDSVFAPTSFWYTAIPLVTPLHPNSKNYVAEVLRQKTAYYGTINVNTNAYSSPVYVVPAGAATVTVAVWDCQHKGYLDKGLQAQWTAVPIPTNAIPSPGTDAEMTVYQPSTHTMWEFWQTKRVNGQWEACWGGQMKNTNTSNGVWAGFYGTTATGLPFLGGQITAEELQRGEIRHVIGIALVDTEVSTIFSAPAARSDGFNPTSALNRIPEGTRFRLDPTIDVATLSISPIAKIIAKAAQIYGFVVWDKAGSLSLRAEDPSSYITQGLANPYAAVYNGTPSYALLNGFPWDKLQFLPMNYPNS